MSTDRPILFSAPMVRALLAGTKTQTRRIVKSTGLYAVDASFHGAETARRELAALATQCPYGVPGDRLWVRESVFINHFLGLQVPQADRATTELFYRATDEEGMRNWEDTEGVRWTPSIHMPRWASRITLEVTGVRVERLQAIGVRDAIAEGIPAGGPENPDRIEVRDYRRLWNSINGPGSWDANPWVWVVEFRRLKP